MIKRDTNWGAARLAVASTPVGVLGDTALARALGSAFLALGYPVMLGTGDPSRAPIRSWLAQAWGRGSVGSLAGAAKFGQIVALATPVQDTAAVLEAVGRSNLAGKIVIDATNPIPVTHPMAGPPSVGSESHGERLQRELPGARVVKAFNATGPDALLAYGLPGGPPTMFLCGGDDAAKATVGEICVAFGWAPVDLGGMEASALLESLGLLWWALRLQTGSGRHAFKVLRGRAAGPAIV